MHAPQMVFGLQGLGRSVTGTIGAAAALLAVAPLLVPLALVAMVPGWLASGRRGPRSTYSAPSIPRATASAATWPAC